MTCCDAIFLCHKMGPTPASSQTQPKLRWLVFGAGAIGTYIGGSLALDGHAVWFLERPEVADDLRQRGLRLTFPEKESHIAAPSLAGSLEEALANGPFDVAIFAVKSYDTQSALKSLRPFRQALPPILCLQNGVENEPTLQAALGPNKVIPGTVTSAIGRRAAGDILLERERGVGLAAGHPLSISVAQALESAGLNTRLYRRASDMKWSKMFTNLPANATSAILDMTPAEIFAHRGVYNLEIAQLREALSVMRAQGFHVVNLPATPASLLAFAVRYLPVEISRPLLRRGIGGGRGGKMPSFYLDLHSGHGKSEVDYLNGAVVRFGERLNVPTPVNRLLNETLMALTKGDLPLNTFQSQPEKLLSLRKNRKIS